MLSGSPVCPSASEPGDHRVALQLILTGSRRPGSGPQPGEPPRYRDLRLAGLEQEEAATAAVLNSRLLVALRLHHWMAKGIVEPCLHGRLEDLKAGQTPQFRHHRECVIDV
eukprot:CAMPEP_0170620126 /NCGR_PEP_ID=MMETSP0224-20130122/27891_1 /TAXON_ID=285029 /ORGANISM="Togula jolla, Strain CCCM 725" /LENGTH=110 /DNA_ID=CAMNT_0010946277 /DNA_START=411 /DNA_END=745 /DNA_ORIENTATION=+